MDNKKFISVDGLRVVKNVGTNQIDLTHLGYASQIAPVELYLKEDGTLENGPSLCIVNVGAGYKHTFSQISIKTLNEALNKLGYEIKKKNEGEG